MRTSAKEGRGSQIETQVAVLDGETPGRTLVSQKRVMVF